MNCVWGIALFLVCAVFPREGHSQNYLHYYHRIATAESLVVNARYQEAIQEYENAFSEFPFNNPTDCYVAAQVAAYVGDSVRCKRFLKAGASFGLPVETIQSNPHLAEYIFVANPFSLNKTEADSCWDVYLKRINREARASAISLAKLDQEKIHNVPGSIYEKDGGTLIDGYRPFWDSLLHEVIRITRTYGFPAEKIAGTQNGDDSLFLVGPGSAFVFYIFIHHGNVWPQMGELLLNELKNGNITPQMFGAIRDESNGSRDYEDYKYLAIRSCISSAYRSKCNKRIKGRLGELNAVRQEIGLCSYEVMEQKERSTHAFKKWRKEQPADGKPVFDFPLATSFVGTNSQ